METPEERAARSEIRGGLYRWGRLRRTVAAQRDPLVLGALEAGISIEEIHQSTGLGRSTIDRIAKGASDA